MHLVSLTKGVWGVTLPIDVTSFINITKVNWLRMHRFRIGY